MKGSLLGAFLAGGEIYWEWEGREWWMKWGKAEEFFFCREFFGGVARLRLGLDL